MIVIAGTAGDGGLAAREDPGRQWHRDRDRRLLSPVGQTLTMVPMKSPDRPDEPPDSQRLLADARGGQRAALQSLLLRHLAPLRAFVRLQASPVLRQREGESDLVQDVCLEVLQRGERFEFRSEAEFRGWLYRAVLNTLRDSDRYHKAQRRAPGRENPVSDLDQLASVYASVTSPSAGAAAREEVARIEAAFTRLPPHYAEVLALVHVAGLSRGEIAEQLQMSPEAVSKRLVRAKLRLIKELGR